MAELSAHNRLVAGSSPVGYTIKHDRVAPFTVAIYFILISPYIIDGCIANYFFLYKWNILYNMEYKLMYKLRRRYNEKS